MACGWLVKERMIGLSGWVGALAHQIVTGLGSFLACNNIFVVQRLVGKYD